MTSHEAQPLVGGTLLSDSIKSVLMDRIMHGYYKPGERIVELRVAKELGTSQSPVREALRDLAAIGIIEMESRRGSRVRMPTGKELADISLVRSEVDALAATLATPRMNRHLLADLRGIYGEMKAHLDDENYVAMTQADAAFHRLIAKASDNIAIERVFDQLEPFARTFITLTIPNVDVRSIIVQHEVILDALESGDGAAAATRARDHQLAVGALLWSN